MEVQTIADDIILTEALNQSMSYQEYRHLTDDLFEQGKTTGDNHSEAMLAYTKQNIHRMARHDRTDKLIEGIEERFSGVHKPQIWMLITEAWCGDAAHAVPMIAKLADLSPKITLKIVLRDEHLQYMDRYLTNGGRSIPKLIAYDAETMKELGTWGPRPQPAVKIQKDGKAAGTPAGELKEKLQLWYGRDRNKAIQQEFMDLIDSWERGQ